MTKEEIFNKVQWNQKSDYWKRMSAKPSEIAFCNTCFGCKASFPWTSNKKLVDYNKKVYCYSCFFDNKKVVMK